VLFHCHSFRYAEELVCKFEIGTNIGSHHHYQ
jgi:hypothetical protein